MTTMLDTTSPLNFTVHEKLRILMRMLRPATSPRWGALFVTKNCNLDCKYCQVPTRHPMDDLPTEDWIRIIDRLATLGLRATTIVGGEPTSRPDLPELIAHMRKRGILPCLISNFLLLDNHYVEEIASAGLFSLQASIDSLHGRGRGSRKWLDLLQYAGSLGILPLASTVVTARNVEELPQLAEETTRRGIIYNCSLYQEVNGVFSVKVPGHKPPADKLRRAFREVESIKRRTGLVRTTYRYLRSIDQFYNQGIWHCDGKRDSWLNVNADGTLMPCQEYESSVSILDIVSLQDNSWRQVKEAAANNCAGCYYQCYFEQETSGLKTLLQETRTIAAGWHLLSTGRTTYQASQAPH